jgi:hypothetical protein
MSLFGLIASTSTHFVLLPFIKPWLIFLCKPFLERIWRVYCLGSRLFSPFWSSRNHSFPLNQGISLISMTQNNGDFTDQSSDRLLLPEVAIGLWSISRASVICSSTTIPFIFRFLFNSHLFVPFRSANVLVLVDGFHFTAFGFVHIDQLLTRFPV